MPSLNRLSPWFGIHYSDAQIVTKSPYEGKPGIIEDMEEEAAVWPGVLRLYSQKQKLEEA